MAKLKKLQQSLGFSAKDISKHFLKNGNPVKITSLRSGGNITDDKHAEAVRQIIREVSL